MDAATRHPRRHASPEEVTLARLDDQIGYYDGQAVMSRRLFQWLKLTEILAAALIPIVAGFGAPAGYAAGLGGGIVVLEGVQQLKQYQQNWINYRSTCEALKHEKFVYLAGAGPYRHARNAAALLAERIEGLISQETSKWELAQEEHHQHGEG